MERRLAFRKLGFLFSVSVLPPIDRSEDKIRLVATIDDKLKQEMEMIHEVEERDAEKHDRTKPEWSNTVEMLVRKGVKAYKTEASKE